ncbi:MAG: histidine phosphatase family protein [Candidatus Moranbacteria bacterium]|nr:histidine phosphatase family protein [Candidatus Moranbacteria bacterium]
MPHTTFYLVRHGQSESNALGLMSSYPEVPGRTVRHLTEQGIHEVKETAEKLREEGIDAIIASPLTRTVETATLISEATGVPVLQDIRLRETDFGMYNAGPVAKFFKVYTEPEMRIMTDGSDGVESFESMRARVESILHDVKKEFAGKKVVLVSHADTLEQIHGVLTKESVEVSVMGWSPKTGSVLKIDC